MSMVAHPHHGLHVSPHRLRQLTTAMLVLAVVIASAAAISLLPAGHTTYPAGVLQTRVAQLHFGMTPYAARQVMGVPTQQVAYGRGLSYRVWTYEARSGSPVYRLVFNSRMLLSVSRR